MTAAMAPSASSDSNTPRRWSKVLLILSLAINLLFAGAVTAALIGAHRGVGPFGGPFVGSPNLLAFLRTLTPERRDSIWHGAAQERTALGPMRKDMRRTRDAMHRALATEPFDKEKFAETVKAFDDMEARLRQSAIGLITAVAAKLTVEERRAYLTWQSKFRRGHKRGHADRGVKDDSHVERKP